MRTRWPVLLALLLAACHEPSNHGRGGDFAMLTRADPGYQQALPGMPIEFPRDHGMHPGFRIEWWYLTANLEDDQGRPFGVQWTLFRTASSPPGTAASGNPWQDPQVFMAHFAISTPTDHMAFQRYARGGEHEGLAQAGVQAKPFMAWLDDWTLQSAGPEWLPLGLRARQDGYAVELELNADRPPVLQGTGGFSQKHPEGGGSHYYSQPFLSAIGTLIIDHVAIRVKGKAWLDREWSSQFLQPDQEGWDWFALHLDSGEKLMVFQLRPVGNQGKPYVHAALVDREGNKQSLDSSGIRLQIIERQRVAGRELPLHWRLELTGIDRVLDVRALHPEQWLDVDFPYWEGVVRARGDGPGSSGQGYLEMTGYPRAQ
ncbi:MAG: lipocalin-like domain-containing protein [Lysobacterales bacterium]